MRLRGRWRGGRGSDRISQEVGRGSGGGEGRRRRIERGVKGRCMGRKERGAEWSEVEGVRAMEQRRGDGMGRGLIKWRGSEEKRGGEARRGEGGGTARLGLYLLVPIPLSRQLLP